MIWNIRKQKTTSQSPRRKMNPRKMAQVKEQLKTPEKELKEMEINKQSLRCKIQNACYKNAQGT